MSRFVEIGTYMGSGEGGKPTMNRMGTYTPLLPSNFKALSNLPSTSFGLDGALINVPWLMPVASGVVSWYSTATISSMCHKPTVLDPPSIWAFDVDMITLVSRNTDK